MRERVGQRVHGLGVGDVAGVGDRAGPGVAPDEAGRPLQFGAVPCANGDSRACPGQLAGDQQTEAPRAAGDQYRAVAEPPGSPGSAFYALDVMFTGPMRLTLALLPGMRVRGDTRIVNITSLGGRLAPPHLLPYAAAKFAAVGFSEGLRAELAGSGVAVTTVVPGLMRTGSHRAARFGGRHGREYAWFAAAASMPLLSMDAERAARAIVRAASRGRAEIVLTPAAKAAVRCHGLAPATTVRLLGLAARVLPGTPEGDGGVGLDVPGTVARADGAPSWSHRLSVLGERAAERWNEPRLH